MDSVSNNVCYLNHVFHPVRKFAIQSILGKPHAVIMIDQQDGNITKSAVAICCMKQDVSELD